MSFPSGLVMGTLVNGRPAFLRRNTDLGDSSWTVVGVHPLLSTRQVDVQAVANRVRIAQTLMSRDAGRTFSTVGLMTLRWFTPVLRALGVRAVTYGGSHFLVGHGESAFAGWEGMGVSSDFGVTWTRYTNLPPLIPPMDAWHLAAIDIQQNGEVTVLLRRSLAANEPCYYFYSDDMGQTWHGGVICIPASPLPWTGGTIHQTSNRSLSSLRVMRRGDLVVVSGAEGWTEQRYISAYGVPRRAWIPGPITYEDHTFRYCPTDYIYCYSLDKGVTWSEPFRVKNDENQTLDGGGTKAWGLTVPQIGIGVGPESVPGWQGPDIGYYAGDLYLFSRTFQINKRTGSWPSPDPPAIGWQHDFTPIDYDEVFLVYKMPGVVGAPERTVVTLTAEPHVASSPPRMVSGTLSSISLVNDYYGQTLILAGLYRNPPVRDSIIPNTVTMSLREIWMNGSWTGNLVVPVVNAVGVSTAASFQMDWHLFYAEWLARAPYVFSYDVDLE